MTSKIHAAIGDPWSREVIMASLREASEVSGRSVDELTGEKTDLFTAQARQAAIWDAHSKGVTNAVLSRFFQRDHTTIAHAIKKSEARYRKNAACASVPFFKSVRRERKNAE